jgi:hypothetical protein
MLVLANTVTKRERRIMFLRTQSSSAPDDLRFGLGIAAGALPPALGPDIQLNDADILSTSTPVATQYTSSLAMPRVLTDSSAIFHGLVESTDQYLGALGQCNVRVFYPRWNGFDTNGEGTLASVKSAVVSFSMTHNENVISMCMFESPTKPSISILYEAHALLAILTNTGRLKIWRVVTDGTNAPTFTEIAEISLFDYVPTETLSINNRIRYIGGCFHLTRSVANGSYVIPWVTAFGNTLPLPIRETHHHTLPIPHGNNYYAVGEAKAIRMGRINFTDDEFF